MSGFDQERKPVTLSSRTGGPMHFQHALLDIVRGDETATILQSEAFGFRHQSYGFLPGTSTIVTGGDNGHLTLMDLSGARLGEFVCHDGTIMSLAASADGVLLASGGDDHVICFWNARNRTLIATLYTARDDRWIMWTPREYYAASPGGERLIGWLVAQAGQEQPVLVSAGSLPELDRPDIVEEAIRRRDGGVFAVAHGSQAPPPDLATRSKKN